MESGTGAAAPLRYLKAEKAKLEVLCSAACQAYPVEPPDGEATSTAGLEPGRGK